MSSGVSIGSAVCKSGPAFQYKWMLSVSSYISTICQMRQRASVTTLHDLFDTSVPIAMYQIEQNKVSVILVVKERKARFSPILSSEIEATSYTTFHVKSIMSGAPSAR